TNNTSSTSNKSSSDSKKASKPKQETTTNVVKSSGGGGTAISAGKQFIGKSTYVFGAKNPGAGQFDCSGFVSWAYQQEGVSLPRSTAGMKNVGSKISYGEAQPGDLVFFNTY